MRIRLMLCCCPLLACLAALPAIAQDAPADDAAAGGPPGFALRYELSYPAYVGINPTLTPGQPPQLLLQAVADWAALQANAGAAAEEPLAHYFDTEYVGGSSVLVHRQIAWYAIDSDEPALLAELIEATSGIEFCRLTEVVPIKFYNMQKYPEYYSSPHTVTVDGVTRNFPWDFTYAQQDWLYHSFLSRRDKGVPEWSAGSLDWLNGSGAHTTAYRTEADSQGNLIITTIATEPLTPEFELPPDFICVTIPQQHSIDTDEEALRSLARDLRRGYLPEDQQEQGDGASWVEVRAIEVRVPLLPEETWLAALRGEISGEVDPATRLLMTARSAELQKVFEDWLLTHPELRDEIGVSRTGYADEEWHIFDWEKRDYLPLAFVGVVYTDRAEIQAELLALMRASQDVHEPVICEHLAPRLQRDWPPTV